MLRGAKPRAAGKFVLYWMHTAVRSEQNPALDVAMHEAASRKLPLLVASFLLKKHTYPTHRRYKFLLEGIRDVQSSLDAKVITYVSLPERARTCEWHELFKQPLEIGKSICFSRLCLRDSPSLCTLFEGQCQDSSLLSR